MRTLTFATALAVAVSPIAAPAQLRLPGGLGGGIPGLGSAGVGNVAGLLGFCLKNQLLAGSAAGSANGLLGKLSGKPEVAQSPGFSLGQLGQVQQPGGGALPLGGLSGSLKTQACNMVLKRAGSFM